MKKIIVAISVFLFAAVGLLFSFSPDHFTMFILVLMTAVIVLGYVLGIGPAFSLTDGFRNGRKNIQKALDVDATDTWITVFQLDRLFHHKKLDAIYHEYVYKVEEEKEFDETESDIESYLSEDYLSLHTWQNLILQIPNILTGLGILGTFVGLITGISGIGFSSVEATLESISQLLSGIETAFYTSIAGVILSILFNITNRIVWNTLLREHGLFLSDFHKLVIPSAEISSRIRADKVLKQIAGRLDRLPRQNEYGLADIDENAAAANERSLMPQVLEGIRNNEFTFYLQPRLSLSNKKMVAAEATVRWNHKTLGVLLPSSFAPMLERNGFITKLDAYIWEQVFVHMRKWLNAGIRPVPIAVKVSKIDLMALNIEDIFTRLLEEYQIPPRYIEIEIAKNAFEQSDLIAGSVASNLRRMGFKVLIDGFDGDFISLNMLNQLEIDGLKLDLRNMPQSGFALIEAVFEKGRKLNVEVLADGVENAEQVTYLRKSGCMEGQGFYFNRPMSIDAFEANLG